MGIRKLGKIGVLMGGPSSERDISLKSGKAVYDNLKDAEFDVVSIDILTDTVSENIKLIKSHGIDCAFIALHGRFGEDGQVQELLEGLKIPYTGSGVKASRLAIDKIASRDIFEKNGLCVPNYKILKKHAYKPGLDLGLSGFKYPLVVKPATNGSSIGLSIVDKKGGIKKAIDLAFDFDDRILIEEYILGREITVGILEEQALPVIEVVPKNRFFDFEAKYQAGMTEYIVPAMIDKKVAGASKKAALIAHRLLGCFGCSRVDIILDKNNVPYVLEINTIPGLTSTSLLPKAAKIIGIDFTQLCIKLLRLAYAKK